MNPFLRLDSFLLCRVFQPIVDLSQRGPHWWVRQSAVLAFLLMVISGVLQGWDWSRAVTLLAFVPMALGVSLSPLLMAWLGAWTVYRVLVATIFLMLAALAVAANLFLVWHGHPAAIPPVDNFATAAQVAMAYFAACRPPKPRVPRAAPRTAFGGAV